MAYREHWDIFVDEEGEYISNKVMIGRAGITSRAQQQHMVGAPSNQGRLPLLWLPQIARLHVPAEKDQATT